MIRHRSYGVRGTLGGLVEELRASLATIVLNVALRIHFRATYDMIVDLAELTKRGPS